MLPNVVVLAVLQIAVAVVTVVMWFAALFTARVPEGMWQFSKGVLQWGARTDAYALFLTDRYPPFGLDDVSYPVWMAVDRPDRFNRLAVLFRAILVIPAGIVQSVFTLGMYVFFVVTWILTLVLGRCPRALHLVLAAWLRYQLRYSAYAYLLTTTYPSAPLGDRQSSYGSLESGEIVLRGAAKAFAVVALVLGTVFYMSDFALPAVLGAHGAARTAIGQLDALQSRSASADASFRTQVGGCASTWRCVDRDTSILERSLQTQISTIEAITFPTAATRDDASSLLPLLREERSVLNQVPGAGTQHTFDSDLNRVVALTRRLQPLVRKLQLDLGSTP